ncbi:diaminopimelate epimerase [Microvirga sp. W0021]|uniref:Diaminopimelate epimerase n=1 Tax=Hohaiivirga grylli TaxID=3133970 RepID=A0ABV0BFR7_9HYPH
MSNYLTNHRFLKMNGLGNEIVVLDLRGEKHIVTSDEAIAIANDPRSRFDQMMVLHDPVTPGTDAFIRIYNTDGTIAGGCGNGTRCVAWALMADAEISAGFQGTKLHLETKMGPLVCERRGDVEFTVDMGVPLFGWQDIPLAHEVTDTLAFEVPLEGYKFVPAAGVSVGNPHIIFFIDNVADWDVHKVGPSLEHHPLFPERANISFAQLVAPDHFKVVVWERGAGATRACGTASCAVAVCAYRKGLAGRDVTVSLPGGDLQIEWRDNGHMFMTGPVELEWEDHFRPELFAGVR